MRVLTLTSAPAAALVLVGRRGAQIGWGLACFSLQPSLPILAHEAGRAINGSGLWSGARKPEPDLRKLGAQWALEGCGCTVPAYIYASTRTALHCCADFAPIILCAVADSKAALQGTDLEAHLYKHACGKDATLGVAPKGPHHRLVSGGTP